MSTVLLVGQDEMLQYTRAALLRTLGAETICCDGSEALHVQQNCQCDLVILCHSLPGQLSASLAETIHASWPRTRIMRIAAREWELVGNASPADLVSSGDPASL